MKSNYELINSKENAQFDMIEDNIPSVNGAEGCQLPFD